MRVGITTSSFAESNMKPKMMLEEAEMEVIDNPYKRRLTESEVFEFILDKDGLIAGLEPLNKKVLKNAKRLKAIARVGIGTENVDLNSVDELGIKLSNTPDGPTNAVAELTITAALDLCRKLSATNRKIHNGRWSKNISRSLQGQHVLFIGYGRIGRRTAELMRPFGVKILVADPFIDKNDLKEDECNVSLNEGLLHADIISLHAGGNDTILSEDQFKLIKSGVILLNSARGELVDENALIDAIDSGKVESAWFDAFWKEPYKGRLLQYPNVLLTPHIGTYTEQCRFSMEMEAVNNLLRDLGVKER